MKPAALSALVSSGVPIQAALDELGVSEVDDELISLAIRTGAPLVPALAVLQEQQLHVMRTESELLQAQAIPRATRKLLLWLPVITVGLSELLGLGTLKGLLHPVGLVALLMASGLLFLGGKISARMLSQIDFRQAHPAHELIALSICLSAGMGLGQIKDQIPKLFSERSEKLIALSRRTGASLGGLIAAEIANLNQTQLTSQLSKAKQLSVSLLIPLSLTTLPAFLLLTIPPMLIGITQ